MKTQANNLGFFLENGLKMKIKITLAFLVLSILFVFLVFKGKYFSVNQGPEVAGTKNVLTSEAVVGKFETSDLRDYKGNKISIAKASLAGHQGIIIHLWASWCAPCVNEVPELIAYAKKNPDVKFIIVSLDDIQDDIAKFLKSFPEFDSDKFIKIWDGPNAISKYLDADRLPMSVIIRKDKPEPQIVKSVVDWKTFKL